MANITMGAVGERDAVLCFKAIGMQVVPTETPEETTKALFTLTRQGVRVIFITEHAAKQATEALQRYKDDPANRHYSHTGQYGRKRICDVAH